MCGIIAYNGFRDSQQVLLKGLKTIQYRGYDSMGMVIASKTGLKRVRSVGDITKLKKKASKIQGLSGHSGIGHSRWATHGAPTEINAHPHKAGPIYLVHNGIIENAEELKAWLKGPFVSETDSEVLACLLSEAYQQSQCLKQAVFNIIPKIKGEYAVVALSKNEPSRLLAFKKGPSLLIGIGKKEIFLCSDIQGILPYTNKAIFLKDGEVADIQDSKNFTIYSKKNRKIKKNITYLKADKKLTNKEKGPYPYYMLKEIHDQPTCIAELIKTHINPKNNNVEIKWQVGAISKAPLNKTSKFSQKSQKKLQKTSPLGEEILDQILKAKKIGIVACGSSYHSALYGKYVIEQLSSISVEADMASEFRYRFPVWPKSTPLLLISQSGETADTLAVLKMAKAKKIPVLSLCNVPHSSLDRSAAFRLYMLSGVEKAVASTKAFTSTLALLFLLALALGKKNKSLDSKELNKQVKAFSELPELMKWTLAQEKTFISSAHMLSSLKSLIYIGRNVFYPLALEGALKMKELTYKHAEAYPAGEMKHGPLALVDQKMAVLGIVPKSLVYTKTLANLQEAKSREGKLILIGDKGDKTAQSLTQHFLPVPATLKGSKKALIDSAPLSAILCALPLQLIAYHTACALGHNVDQPRNLAKSVTVE